MSQAAASDVRASMCQLGVDVSLDIPGNGGKPCLAMLIYLAMVFLPSYLPLPSLFKSSLPLHMHAYTLFSLSFSLSLCVSLSFSISLSLPLSLSPSLSLSKHFVVGVLPPSFRELPAPQSLPNTNTHTHASYLDHCHSQHIYLVVVWCFLLDSQGTSNTSTPYRRCSLSFAPQETHQMTRYVQCMLIACLIHSCKALKQSNGQVGCCR